MNVLFLVYTTAANGKRYWVKLSTPPQPPHSVLFGSTDHLDAPQSTLGAINFGSGDMTLELWVNPATISTSPQCVFSSWSATSQQFYVFIASNRVTFGFSNSSGFTSLTSPTVATPPVPTNKWSHICVMKTGTVLNMFINGVQQTTGNSGPIITAKQGPVVGSNPVNITGTFSGYIADARIVVGSSVYSTTGFTPPTTPLTSIPGTQFLACNAASLIDDGPNNYPLTINGSPTVSTVTPYPAIPDTSSVVQYYQSGGFQTINSGDANYPKIPEAQSAQASYTPDGQYLVMPTSTGIIGYQQVGASTNVLTFPTQAAGLLDAKISSDSNFVVGVNTFPPYAVCYQRSTATNFVTGGNLTTIHQTAATCCDFTNGGNYLAIGGNALYLYKKNVATFTSLVSPINQTVQAVKFSSDSTILYVGTGSGLFVLNRSSDTFTQNAWTISGNIQGIDVYSKYLAVTTDTGLTVYDTSTQASVYAYSTTTAKSVKFSSDGQHIAVEHTSTPYFEVLQWQ